MRHLSHHCPNYGCGTAIIGTSLVYGLWQRMHKLDISAPTFMYRGSTVPVLQNRVKHSRNQPERISVVATMPIVNRPLPLVLALRP